MDRDHISRIARHIKNAHLDLWERSDPYCAQMECRDALRELAPLLKEAAVSEREWLAWDREQREAARW